MYSSIRISGYRGLDSFRMEGLGHVNLLVGANNSGKTSILECIELLRSAGNPGVLSSIAGRRGESLSVSGGNALASFRVARAVVSHLFANHTLCGAIHIEADRSHDVAGADWNDRVTIRVDDPSGSELDEWGPDRGEWGTEVGHDGPLLILHVKWSDSEDAYRAFLTGQGLLLQEVRRAKRQRNGAKQAVQFIRTSGMSASDVARMFDQVVLTESEEAVTQALRILDPDIERIATVSDDMERGSSYVPGGVLLKLAGSTARVPIGSMGDGTWRMLGLALSLANARGGVLLIDEIDTGLHYGVMEKMWRMISEQAAALSVQVFATTHSRDCYESLAAIAKSDAEEVTIQRIERDRGEAVRFSNRAIVAAAERDVEVR